MGVVLGQSLKYMDIYFFFFFRTAFHGIMSQCLVIMHAVKIFFSLLKKATCFVVRWCPPPSNTELRGYFYKNLSLNLFLF